MSGPGRDERTLRRAIAARAAELGASLRPEDLRLQYDDLPGAPAYRVVRATWGAGGSADGLSGLLREGADPDLLPGHAVGVLLGDWDGTATDAAAAVALLLDPMARWEPLLTAAEVSGWRSAEGPVEPPELRPGATAGAATRLAYWWHRDATARQVVVEVDAAGRTTVGGGRTAVRVGQDLDAEGGLP